MQFLKYILISVVGILFLFISAGCEQQVEKAKIDRQTLQGTWFLTGVVKSKSMFGESEQQRQSNTNFEVMKQGLVMSFFDDAQFTFILKDGGYTLGKWELDTDQKRISLNYKKEILTFTYASKIEQQQWVIELTDENSGNKLILKRIAKPLKDYTQDQFYPANNQWRIHANSPESDEKLKARIANYVQHVALVFKSSTERKEGVISFTFSLGPVKLFDGNIGIYPYDEVPDAWKITFFNDEQANEAYKLYEYYLNNTVYKGETTGKWIEDDRLVLENLYRVIQSNALNLSQE
jgi:hypothetical protein